MSLTGFDPDLVNGSINNVKSAYENLIQVLGDDMQNQFVVGMSDKWACTDAQNFFNNNFKPAIDNLIQGATTIFESVVNSMNSAGQAWASQTESAYAPVSFAAINKSIDTSSIRENIAGVRGVDLSAATTVAGKLSSIATSANSALTSAQQAVQNCGFVGGSMESNLVSALGVIKSKIDTATEELFTETKSAVDATVQRYGNQEGKVSEAFSTEG